MNPGAWRNAAIMLVAAMLGGWFLALRPELDARETAEQEAIVLAERLSAYRATAAELATWRDRTQALQRRIDDHPMRLPATPDLPGLLGRVADLARATDVQLMGVEPGEPVRRDDHLQRPITLRVQGRWDGLIKWLVRLSRGTRSVALTGLVIRRRDTESVDHPLALTLTVTGHWHGNKGNPQGRGAGRAGWVGPAPAEPAGLPERLRADPFSMSRSDAGKAATGLAYLGRIQVGGQTWALIRDAGGRIHRRRPGAVLPGGGRLDRVTAEAITIHRPGRGAAQSGPATRLRIGINRSGE